MGNLKNTLKKAKIESKEISIESFDDDITIFPITGMGLIKMKDLSEKMTTIQTNIEKVNAALDSITNVDSENLPNKLDDIKKLNATSNDLQNEFNTIQTDLISFALRFGCKADEDDIEFMLDNYLVECLQLVKDIIEYSSEYNEAKMKEAELSKKKSKK